MRRGASAVEFALCLPFVLLFVVGSTDFALWAGLHMTTVRAVQDGARVASVLVVPDGEDATVTLESTAESATLETLTLWGASSGASVDATWAADGDGIMWLTVTAQVTYNPVMGVASPFQRPVLKSFVVMTQEQINN